MRQCLLTIVFCAAAIGASAAPEFWESKPFMMWSDQELARVMTDSPWAQKTSVVLTAAPRATAEAGAERGGGGAGESEGGGRGGGRGGFPVPAPQLKLVITWQTALPMKQAIVRTQSGPGAPISEEMQKVLDRNESQYIVTITGIPVRYTRLIAPMKDVTVLKRGSKPPIVIQGIQGEPGKDSMIVFFGFPREAITLEDKDVEFVTRLGIWDIKKKFRLKDMIFHGKLEL